MSGETRSGRGERHDLVNPATGDISAAITPASADDVGLATSAAAAAFGDWSGRTPGDRARILLRLADLIESDSGELTRLEVEETGKPTAVFAEGELPFAADNLRFFAGSGRSLDGTGAGVLSSGYTSMLVRRPIGVVGSIAPWNFPFVMAIWKMGPALAAGNTMVLKPAPNTPRSTLRLAELAAEAGLPSGVLNIVTGGADIGEAIVRDPLVQMVSVTGSARTGQAVMAAAAPSSKRVHLELGGKAPALVFSDADLGSMARALTLGATYNTGQDCTAATRVYVERSLLADATDALATSMRAVRWGDPLDPSTDIGPLISADHRDRVHGFVSRAVDAGATAVVGGELPAGHGFFYPPTLIIGAQQSSEIVQGEVFGPVLVVVPFDGEGDAVTLANDSPYGLASSVWTSDIARALRVSHQLEVGVTWINDHLPIASEAPHGGVKGSGFGKDMSHESILEYTVTRHIMIKHAVTETPDSFRPS
ncbi:MAG: aldehyde dehydrogenase family protein [Actinobacteria bacterium]|nr:aldehyde dehydrogenase family protein [Actinomycetota bacterium]